MLAVPVPESVTVDVAPVVELLTIFSVPLTAPAEVGAKVTGIASVCPAARVAGRVIAGIENPVPVTERELIVTGTVPDEVTVTDKALEVPSLMLP